MNRIRRSRPLAGAFACVALSVLAACSDMATNPDPGTTSDDPALAARRAQPGSSVAPFYAGAYLGDAASTPQNIAAAIRAFGAMTGNQPALVKTFHSLDCDFGAAGWCGQVLRAAAGTGATNYVALDLRWAGAPAGGVLDAINSGAADARITAVAQGVRSLGGVVLLEPGWEMNGDWNYAWQGASNGASASAAAKYTAAWRHLVNIFRAQGASNVRWVFNPNVGNAFTHSASGASHWNWYANYYPGDGYVDYVGAHGFNGPAVWGGAWQDFASMTDGSAADRMLSDLAARYPSKPIIIGEFASQEGSAGQKAAWITDAYARLRANPRVVGAVWFNANKEADWRVESSPAALEAYRGAVTRPGVQTAFSAAAPSGNRLASLD